MTSAISCFGNEFIGRSSCITTEILSTLEPEPTQTMFDPKPDGSKTTNALETQTSSADAGIVRPSSEASTVAATPSRTTGIIATQTATPGGTAVESTSPLPSVSSGGGSQGVSKGAVAGIAISTAIIGAAVALLAAFFFFKRRRHPSRHPYGDSTPDFDSHMNAKNAPYVQVSQTPVPPPVLAAVSPAHRDLNLANLSNSSDFLAQVLPSAADEQTVKNKVAALFNQFQRHVDSYYRDVNATMTPSMESDLARFGTNLIEILENSSMPTVAIKHALAGYILSIVSSEAEDQATLFPAEITGLKANERSTDMSDQAAYIMYKRLAVHLHAPNPASHQSCQSDIREAAEHFALTFFPWANPAYHEKEKDEELVRIISEALDVSIWLYGQPYLYEFVWEGVGRRGTVVAPGLARLTDGSGRILERPQILLEPTVAAS
ncbi:hypothetical protein K458DRAFT_413851 [Lentithecium fluviatile CBS 122367]|uniref:Uncharacterized protein n=1 Tax=Lentithecium fluviatile CBS 122367 TaxID=1168545 RepID=A0A6G1JH78_9PLEO|nr:hypothetical protein K458DRAFT_413851 [Lentithecium fluviatile CBS 122367]